MYYGFVDQMAILADPKKWNEDHPSGTPEDQVRIDAVAVRWERMIRFKDRKALNDAFDPAI